MIMVTIAFLLGMVLCMLFGVPYIDMLKKKTIGQYIKDVAPENHAKNKEHRQQEGYSLLLLLLWHQ